MDSAHLSCRANRMLLNQGPSWRQRSQPQPVNQAQDLSEQGSWYGDLRHLERDVATVLYHPGADLDQFLAHRRERSMLDLQRQRQCLLWVITGPGRPCPAASAVRGRADLHAEKADVAARRSPLGGRAVVPATWSQLPLIAISGPQASSHERWIPPSKSLGRVVI